MHTLLQFVVRNRHWFLFLLLEAVSMALLFRYNAYQGSVWTTSANGVAGAIYEWQSGAKAYFALSRVNDSLTGRNIELEHEVGRLRELCRAAGADESMPDSAHQAFLRHHVTVKAKVVGSSLGSPDNLITINSGSADSVKSDMAVVSGNGVVGVVVNTSSDYAVVMPLINVRSRVSCRLKGRSYLGYLQWDAQDPGISYVEDIPRYAQFEIGDSVETSGYSSIYPEGILIGQIIDREDADDGVSYRLKVRLAVDFASVRDVRVVLDRDYAQRAALLKAAKETLEKKK